MTGDPKLILVLEENSEDHFLLSQFLEQLGFEVCQAADYRELVKKATELQPALIIYSASLINPSSLQLIRNSPDLAGIPLLLMMPESSSQGLHRHAHYADESITKPLDLDELERRIQWLLRRPEAIGRRTEPIRAPKMQVAPSMESDLRPPASPARLRPDCLDLYERTREYLLRCFQAVSEGADIDFESAQNLVDEIQTSLLQDNSLLERTLDQRAFYSLSEHSTNVCIISVMLALQLPEMVSDIKLLGQAALFHDIGSIRLPHNFLFKLGHFTQAEVDELRKRPEYSRDVILSQTQEVTRLAEIVYQAYEREDGSGYPSGLSGEQICLEAKIVGLIDYYEGITHSRPHRNGLSGFEALNELLARPRPLFPIELLATLIRSISLYSVNEYVLLNTGEVGRVAHLTSNPVRPVVEIFIGGQGERLPQPQRVNLTGDGGRVVVKPLVAEEVLLRFSGAVS